MQLTGDFVEEIGLKGSESLPAILALGTIEEAPFPLRQMFIPAVHSNFLKETKREQYSIRKALETLSREVPLPFQEEDFLDAKDELVADYLCSGVSANFNRLSPEIFQVNRIIPYRIVGSRGVDRETNLVIPLFANVGLDQECWRYEVNDHGDSVKIESTAPPMTRGAKENVKTFRAIYMESVSRALREPFISDIVLRDLEIGKADPQIKMYWIPKPEDLRIEAKVRDRDPFIAATVYDRHFLLANWDVQGEMPYEHYLKEFRGK